MILLTLSKTAQASRNRPSLRLVPSPAGRAPESLARVRPITPMRAIPSGAALGHPLPGRCATSLRAARATQTPSPREEVPRPTTDGDTTSGERSRFPCARRAHLWAIPRVPVVSPIRIIAGHQCQKVRDMSQMPSRSEERTGRLLVLRNQLIDDAKQPDSPGGPVITDREWSRIQTVDAEAKDSADDETNDALIVHLLRRGAKTERAHRMMRLLINNEGPEAA